jgi:hypothetical protein
MDPLSGVKSLLQPANGILRDPLKIGIFLAAEARGQGNYF